MNNANMDADIPQRAVSIYGANEGMDDFPVLKAFQQYIDAEQEKARKRILWLGAFFGGVLIVVIVVFMVLLHGINTRNQSLSDRLVEYAMKEADRRQAPVAPAVTQNDATLKAMTETLLAIQKKMQDGEAKPVQPAAISFEQERKMREDADKIEIAKQQIAHEKKRLAEEKERLHQIEVEQQRRKLYPECYENESSTNSARRDAPSQKRTHTLTDEDIREIIREAYPEATTQSKEGAVRSKEAPAQPKRYVAEEEIEEEDGAIEYFKDDEYTIPVDVKGSSQKVKFALPIE